MSATPTRSAAGRKGCAYLAISTALVLPASALLWLVVEQALGTLAAGAALFALFAAPFGLGVAIERSATALNRKVRAERVAAVVIPLVCALGLVLAVTRHRALTGRALLDAPARHPWVRGAVGDAFRYVGRAFDGANAASPEATTEPSEAPSARPRRGAAPVSTPGPAFDSGDGSYREEPSCQELSDVSEIERSYRSAGRRASLNALAKARYPAGLPFLEAQTDAELGAWFTGAEDSFSGAASRFDAAVHEGSHIWGFRRFSPSTQSYPLSADSTVRAKRLHNFPRSEILDVHVDPTADTYAKTYLEGASGEQGFNSLLDEYNAYAHSLAARFCTRDLVAANARVTARDGILTFMYYVELYLHLARSRHAADYRAILADDGHREVITRVWDRAELWLRRSASDPRLGVADETIGKWVYAPERLAEITRVREHVAEK